MGFFPCLPAFAAYKSSRMEFEYGMIAHRWLFAKEALVKIRGIACQGQKQGLEKKSGLFCVKTVIKRIKIPSQEFEKIFLGIIFLCPEIDQFAA